jgi:hypothetical protein
VIRSQIERITLTPNEEASSNSSCTAIWRGFRSCARRGGTTDNAPAVVSRGVKCRWLRGHATTYSEHLWRGPSRTDGRSWAQSGPAVRAGRG